MSRPTLTNAQKLFLAGYNPMFATIFGWRQDAINAEFVRTYGVGALLKFGKTIGDTLGMLTDRFGDATAQHVVGFAGMMNGCRFCGVGHNLTANVTIFRDTGELYPIDELEIVTIQMMDDDAIMELFRERLRDAHPRDLALIERMNELRLGAEPSATGDDAYLATALDLWVWNNECTIETGLDIDPHDVPSFARFNGDRDLYARYRAARDAAS